MKCTFKGPHLFDLADSYGDYQCPQEAEFGALCILHAKKDRPDSGASHAQTTQWMELNERCEAAFAKLLETLLGDPDVIKCDFRGFQLTSLSLPKIVCKDL